MDARTGKQIRLGRVLRKETGNAIVVAASHGVLNGPPAGLRTLTEIHDVFAQLRTADGVMVTPGMLPHVAGYFTGRDQPALVMHLDWKSQNRRVYAPGSDGRGEGVLAQLADLDSIAAAGVDAVMTYMYLGQRDTALEREEIARNAAIARDCERLGIGLIIEPRSALEGQDPQALSAEVMSMYCRIAADIGADVIKSMAPRDFDDFEQITQTCFAPVLLAGGPGGDDTASTARLAHDAMRAGARGVMFGRRVYRAAKPAHVLGVLESVVHEGQEPADLAV